MSGSSGTHQTRMNMSSTFVTLTAQAPEARCHAMTTHIASIQLLRSNLAAVAERLATRGVTLDTAAFEALEAERKRLQVHTQDLQAKRNTLSKQFGVMKGKGEDTNAIMLEVAGLGNELKAYESALVELMPRFSTFLELIPNLPHESVHVGKDETGNVEVLRWGTPRAIAAPRKRSLAWMTPMTFSRSPR